jgi:hypothetical protein
MVRASRAGAGREQRDWGRRRLVRERGGQGRPWGIGGTRREKRARRSTTGGQRRASSFMTRSQVACQRGRRGAGSRRVEAAECLVHPVPPYPNASLGSRGLP